MTDEHTILRLITRHARQVLHFNQIAASEIDVGARPFSEDCELAERLLATAILDAEKLLKWKPSRRYPFLLKGTAKIR